MGINAVKYVVPTIVAVGLHSPELGTLTVVSYLGVVEEFDIRQELAPVLEDIRESVLEVQGIPGRAAETTATITVDSPMDPALFLWRGSGAFCSQEVQDRFLAALDAKSIPNQG